jgi:hypothetical protein
MGQSGVEQNAGGGTVAISTFKVRLIGIDHENSYARRSAT